MANLARLRLEVKERVWALRGYTPLPDQHTIHTDKHRIKCIGGGWRGGKSLTSAEEAAPWLLLDLPDAVYWIVGPDYLQARPEFKYLVEGYEGSGVISRVSMPQNGSCHFETVFGATVVTRSSVKERTLGGQAPDGILMVEAAQQTYEAFLTLRGRVSEKRAPLILSGTFEHGKTWYSDLWESWQSANRDDARSFSLPTWHNTVVYPGGRQDPEILALADTFPPDVFQERFGAQPCPPATLVFKEFNHKLHVVRCPYKPSKPVQLWIDPGWAGAYAVSAVQIIGGDVFNIDEVYWTQRTAQEVIQECKDREWWSKVTHAWMDVAGRQHPGMESHVEIWRRLARIPVRTQPVGIPDGILRHRTYLKNPATGKPRLFHDPRCKGAIREYGQYKYHEIKESRPIRELPIDAENHAMKAIAYGLVGNFGFVDARRRRVRSMTYSMSAA